MTYNVFGGTLNLTPSIHFIPTNYGKTSVKYKASKIRNQLPSSLKDSFLYRISVIN